MKKTLLFAIVMTGGLTFSANAALHAQQQVPAGTLQSVKVAGVESRQGQEMSALPQNLQLKSPRRKAATTRPGTVVGRPAGAFWDGLSKDFYSLQLSRLIMPPFVTATFGNYTTDADTYTWSYPSLNYSEDSVLLSSNDQTLSLYYEPSFTPAPKLMAHNSIGDSTYVIAEYVHPGGSSPYIAASDRLFYVTNYDRNNWDLFKYNPDQTKSNGKESNGFFTKALKEKYPSIDTVKVRGSIEFNDAPPAPYLLKGVSAVTAIDTDGKLNLYIVKAVKDADGNYSFGDTLCVSTTDVKANTQSWEVVEFSNLTGLDPETGLESDLVINCPTFTIIEAADEAMKYTPAWASHKTELPNEAHAFILTEISQAGQSTKVPINGNWKYKIGFNSSWAFGYNIAYEYIHNTENTDTYNAPKEGGEKNFRVKSNYVSTTKDGLLWSITTTDGEDIPEWITVTPVDSIYQADGQRYYSGITDIKLNVAALPAGVESRSCNIEFSYPGAKLVLHVNQPGKDADKGDVNADGVVNVSDVTELINVILGTVTDEATKARCYINGDDVINVSDVTELINMILAK